MCDIWCYQETQHPVNSSQDPEHDSLDSVGFCKVVVKDQEVEEGRDDAADGEDGGEDDVWRTGPSSTQDRHNI